MAHFDADTRGSFWSRWIGLGVYVLDRFACYCRSLNPRSNHLFLVEDASLAQEI
jgi:hypothetical protein|tara:strand:- start:578 stop:739 length:162 start_codon:yes stop_codon:yes gene_type:complete